MDADRSETEAALNFDFEHDGYENLAAASFPGTDDLFRNLNAGMAGVDTFESLLNLTHNYGSTM
jgi:hypothetical protein